MPLLVCLQWEDVLCDQGDELGGIDTLDLADNDFVLDTPTRVSAPTPQRQHAHMRTHTLNTKNRGLHPSRRGRPSFCASLKMDESTCTPGVPRHSELSSPPCRLCPANAAHTHRDKDAACVALVIFQVQPLECRPHDFAWPAPCFVDVSHWVGHTSQR